MIPQELTALVAKLLREQPRNQTAIDISEALSRAVASTPVVSTPAPEPVASTRCPACEQRRLSKNKSQQKWRAKANA